jgi:hypothetical protein
MLKDSAIILDAIQRSFLNKSVRAEMFISVRVDFGRHVSRHLLPAPFRLEIPPKKVLPVQSLILISLLHEY